MPPVSPMLAKSVPSIPPDSSYEPKWDGFRSICFRDQGQVELGSRNERPMTRYFPELVAAAKAELPQRCVIDGEIVIATDHGLDFEALQQRIHPADSRVRMLAEKTPASFIAFDLLALGDDDYTGRPFSERRAALVDAVAGSGARAGHSIHVTPATTDLATAQRWFDEFEGAGLDGVVAKPLGITYQPDKRVMFKIKHERTADCVVAGYRVHKSGGDAIGSLLLGLYRDDGALASFDGHPWNWAAHEAGERTPRKNEFSRWNAGKDLSFVPLRPERVVEVRYDHMEGERFRHTAQFNRWRPDRDPRSCTYAQLETPVTFSLGDIVAGLGPASG
jgi:ATP-dependent DNA ligase